MDEKIARELLPLVNNLDFYDDIQMYVNHRITCLHKELETAELVRVDKIQGQIIELKKLQKLREEVQDKARAK